jgi:IMP dehydrogenase
MKKNYTYDDIQLVPQYSEVESRSLVNLKSQLSRNYNLLVPYIASPMDTVCEVKMAKKMMSLGAVGCIHRFMSIEEQATQVREVYDYSFEYDAQKVWVHEPIPIMAAVGANGDYLERAERLINAGANVILIDVAHGHHKNVRIAISEIRNLIDARSPASGDGFLEVANNIDIIAGNVATYDGARDLIDWGADGIRVGIGGGSVCTTRLETGHGIPNVSAIFDCSVIAMEHDIPIIADGGIRYAGDVAKAIAIGASTVMLGSLFAGTEESPGAVIEQDNRLFKRYRGSASMETKNVHSQPRRNVEGESTLVPFKGGAKYTVYRLNDGLSSALSYSGSSTIPEYQRKAQVVSVTNAGIIEAKPHRK